MHQVNIARIVRVTCDLRHHKIPTFFANYQIFGQLYFVELTLYLRIMRNILLFLFILLSVSTWAQEMVIQGRVVDAETGEALPYVSIYAGDGKGTLSNNDGDFKINVDDSDTLSFCCIGYNKQVISANLMTGIIRLKPYTYFMKEVTVRPENYENMLKIVINNLKQDYKKHAKMARKYFFRTTTEMNEGTYIAEAFMMAHSVVNIRSAMITSGLQGKDREGQGGTLNLNSSNIHRLIEVAPMTYGSQFWQNALEPLSSYSTLRKYYDTRIQQIQGDDGKALYQIDFSLKKSISQEIGHMRNITGTAYVDAETYRLLRFDGSCNNYTVNLGWLISFATTINFQLEYDYSQGAASVSHLTIHGGNTQMLFHVLLFAIEPDVEKPHKMNASGSNLVTALRDAGYDASLWEKYDIVKRTREEERAAFGGVKSLTEVNEITSVDTAQTDNAALRTLWQRLWMFSKRYAQEKVFIHMDNTSYCLGDTIWFAAYMRDTDDKKPSLQSSVLYVELLNQEGFLVERKNVEMVEGYGSGFFALNKQGQYGGFYELRAYTRWQLNWGIHERKHSSALTNLFINKEKEQAFFRDYDKLYSRVFPVYDHPLDKNDENRTMTLRPLMGGRKKHDKRKLNIQVYPEGGHLITGMYSQVAFEATWDDGEYAEGTLHVGNKSVKTTNRGRGRFLLSSDTDTQEALTFEADDGTKVKTYLPAPENSGVALHVEEKDGSWHIIVRTTDNINPYNLGLSVMNEGKICYFRQINESATTFHIPTSSLMPGVNQATVFDSHGQVLADRLFFVWKDKTEQPTLKIEGVHDKYQPYEKVEILISRSSSDSISNAYSQYFSLAIRDGERTEHTYDNANIMTEMLLASEIRGFIPDAAWFFQTDDAEHRDALDLLLMVQGWRRFSWKDMAADDVWQPLQPREKTITLMGNVFDIPQCKTSIKRESEANWMLHTEAIDLSNMKHIHFYNVLFDDGQFSILLPHSYNNYVIFMDILENFSNKGIKDRSDRSVEKFSNMQGVRQKKSKKTRENAIISEEQKLCIRIDEPYPRYVQPFCYYLQHLPTGVIQQKQRLHTGFKDDNPTIMISSGEVTYRIEDSGLVLNTLGFGAISVLIQNEFNDDVFFRRGINRLRCHLENMQRIHPDSIYAPKNLKSYPPTFMFSDSELEEYEGVGSIENYVLYTDANLRQPISSQSMPLTIVEYPYRDGYKRKMPVSRSFSMPGFAQRVQFYHPDYNHQLPNRKDYRRTLYWDPCLKLNKKGKAAVTFYNNSRTTHLSIDAEGQAADGTLLWNKRE